MIENKTLRIATVFSGIGSPEQALRKMGIPYSIVFACDNGERELKIDPQIVKKEIYGLTNKKANQIVKKYYLETKKHNYVKDSYFANYKISEDNWFEDIRFINGNEYKNKVDIFVGGSPCQSFSAIGKRGGLEDTRGTLFYDYARLIKEIEPKVFVYENVPGMLNHDNGKTWEIIMSTFKELGYVIFYKVLNSKDYEIPQNRMRLFVVGFKEKKLDFKFPEPRPLLKFLPFFLEDNKYVNPKHYLGKKGFEFVTNPSFKNRANINSTIIRTQKANQQFNWNGDFVFVPFEEIKDSMSILERAYISYWKGKKGAVRQLTYRECLRLMGYDDDFKIVVPNIHAYRQIGNSIVVNVMEYLFKEIFKVQSFDE